MTSIYLESNWQFHCFKSNVAETSESEEKVYMGNDAIWTEVMISADT